MPTQRATLAGMVDLRQSILDRLAVLGWSRTDLVERAIERHGVARSTAFKFLSGDLRGTHTRLIEQMMDVVGLDVRPID